MNKKILFTALVLVFLTGCMKPKTIKPGETVEINKTQEFYFGVLVTDDLEMLQPILEGKTEQEVISLLVNYYDKYQVLPENIRDALLADLVWITPTGVSVEDPSVTLEPKKITWVEKSGNTETTKTVEGYKLIISARIVTSPDAESGDVILQMAQFKTLELANLYFVRVSGGNTISGGDAEVVEDSDIIVVAQVE